MSETRFFSTSQKLIKNREDETKESIVSLDDPLGRRFPISGGEKGDKGFPLSFFKFEFPGSNCPASESPGQANNGGTYLAEQHSIKHGGNNSRRKKECVGSESATPAVDNIVPSRH